MNLCHMCTECPLENDKVEYQEIHITVDVSDKIDEISELFKKYNGKLINLDLGDTNHIMSSIIIKGSRYDAHNKADEIILNLERMNIPVLRKKLESSIFFDNCDGQIGYYEGHIAVDIPIEMLYVLNKWHDIYGWYYSKNLSKPNTYMISFREKRNFKYFENYFNKVVNIIVSEGLHVGKKMQEFCYYDNNIELDKKYFRGMQ